MLTLIALPADFTSSTMGVVSQLFTDFQQPIELFAGVILGVSVLVIVIEALRGKH